MRRAVVMTLLLAAALALTAQDADARKRKGPAHVWYAPPDSAWAIAGFGHHPREDFERLIAKRPPELADAMKALEIQANEQGVWLSLTVWFKRVQRVIFTKNTRLVLIDNSGRRIESEAFVFWPDLMQTSLYDSRKSPVPVSKTSVWCNPNNGCPVGLAKFPTGSIEPGDIQRFEVMGAVEDSTYHPGQ